MSETTAPAAAEQKPARRRPTSLNTMLLADLKALAGGLGIQGASGMKKAQLVEAIKAHQDAHAQSKAAQGRTEQGRTAQGRAQGDQAGDAGAEGGRSAGRAEQTAAEPQSEEPRADRGAEQGDAGRTGDAAEQDAPQERQGGSRRRQRGERNEQQREGQQREGQKDEQDAGQGRDGQQAGQGKGGQQEQKDGGRDKGAQQGRNQGQGKDGQKDRDGQNNQNQNKQRQQAQTHDEDEGDDEGGSRRNRRRRGRERNAARQGGGGRNEPDTTILEDDVLVPAAGILDVLDNYAFVRTSGYLPGTDDVYLSLSMVRRYGLRRGDAVVGQVRQPREGERREKFNPMVRIDSVNGLDPETAKERPEFDSFTPVHPSERLRLETGPDNLLGRIVDVVAPIGKGQRGLVLSPPRSGKTQVLQTIAASIRQNNPECHLMVVLIDERPEEVTDYQRTIRGEVIASTFDRPAADHVLLSELAVERAKRLVELGHDVVILLDSLTRLGRAHNVAGPGSGRVGHGGVDAVALHPALKLFGAARNVEDGGSLTILATALVESGSPLDEAVLDEFNDTSNMELRLRRELVERRVYPPVDVVASGTRREEHLLTPEEQEITWKLRNALMDLEPGEALRRVLARINATQNNVELLTQVQKATPAELAKG